MAHHLLEERDDIFLVYKTHLAVHLGELGLAVGSQVFVSETFGYLEVAVETTHHEQLLERLRTLGQGIELPGVHARGHDKVARSFGGRTDEDGGFHFDEFLCIQEVADKNREPVSQFQIAAYGLAAQVKISIFHADVVASVSIVFDGEGGRCTLAENVELRSDNLDVTGGHLGVLAFAFAHRAGNLDAKFATQLVGLLTELNVNSLIEY